jgi:hypothetical protein
MKINYQEFAKQLERKGMLDRFKNFNKLELKWLAEMVWESTEGGFGIPYIDNGTLVIPFDAPAKYRWWQGGQTIAETLEELGASEEIKQKYRPAGYGEGMKIK